MAPKELEDMKKVLKHGTEFYILKFKNLPSSISVRGADWTLGDF